MCLVAGTSPRQYLCHIFLYVDSSPCVNFAPSQTGDFDISSRSVILSSPRAETSEASCNANLTYSSSVLATRRPKPASNNLNQSLKWKQIGDENNIVYEIKPQSAHSQHSPKYKDHVHVCNKHENYPCDHAYQL